MKGVLGATLEGGPGYHKFWVLSFGQDGTLCNAATFFLRAISRKAPERPRGKPLGARRRPPEGSRVTIYKIK